MKVCHNVTIGGVTRCRLGGAKGLKGGVVRLQLEMMTQVGGNGHELGEVAVIRHSSKRRKRSKRKLHVMRKHKHRSEPKKRNSKRRSGQHRWKTRFAGMQEMHEELKIKAAEKLNAIAKTIADLKLAKHGRRRKAKKARQKVLAKHTKVQQNWERKKKEAESQAAQLAAQTCQAGQSPIAKQWSLFWAKEVPGRNVAGCEAKCVYTIIMSVTQSGIYNQLQDAIEKAEKQVSSSKGSKQSKLKLKDANKKLQEHQLVSGFAVVGDAQAVGKWNTNCKETVVTHACEQMLWVADSIVRDALAAVRFDIAGRVLSKRI